MSKETQRYVIAAELKPGAASGAELTLRAGPPFDPAEAGLTGHAAYLTDDRVYLVFEGAGARTKALRLASEHLPEVSFWQTLVSGLPSTVAEVPAGARCLYRWQSGD